MLDGGSGTGHHAKVLLEKGVGKVTLLDASQEMLQIAQEKLGKYLNGNQAELVQATLPDLPFQDNTFDSVMFNHVMVILLAHLSRRLTR